MMRKLLFVLYVILAGIAAKAQKEFRGTIVYTLHASKEEKKDAEAVIQFGARKIKVHFKEPGDPGDEKKLLIDLDSGKSYNINYTEKVYTETTLRVRKKAEPALPRTIAGYSTTPVPETESSGLNELMGGFVSFSSILIETGDSLYYPVPEQYANSRELLMIKNNHIVLGMTVALKISAYLKKEGDDDPNDNITAMATSVNTDAIPDSEFRIPEGFSKEAAIVGINPAIDSTMVDSVAVTSAMDTAIPVKAKKKPAKKTVPKKKPNVVKAKASMRKP